MISSDLRCEIDCGLAPDRITRVARMESAATVADATAKYILLTECAAELILIISAPISPLLVRRGTDRQREIRAFLPESVAEPIELPILEGLSDGKSYAVWRRRQPFSPHRLCNKFEKALIAPRVYKWLGELAAHSARYSDASSFVDNLEKLQNMPTLPAEIRRAAQRGCRAFRQGEIRPVQVAQHGDLWSGNLLRAPLKARFIVIDWAGATLDGSPFFDLVRLAISLGVSERKLRRAIINYGHSVNCASSDSLSYVLSGLGALLRDLEHFPASRFVKLCEEKWSALHRLFNAY